jgi:hypothetical protein
MDFVRDGKMLIRTLSSAEDVPLTDARIRRAASGAHVFLDTAVRFMEGDEQAAADAKRFAATLFGMQKAGAKSITGAHHSPKALQKADDLSLENVLRGSGDIGAMLATCWGIWQKDEESNKVYVRNVKPRDFEPVAPFEIQGRPHLDESGSFKMVVLPGLSGGKSNPIGRGARLDKLNVQAWIRERLSKPEPGSVAEMHKAAASCGLDIPLGTFKNYVSELRKSDGRAHPDGNGSR